MSRRRHRRPRDGEHDLERHATPIKMARTKMA
jgi:hypothetical protein